MRLFIVYILLFILPVYSWAQVKINTELSKKKAYIGDRIEYTIKISYPTNIKILPYEGITNTGDFDIKDYKAKEEPGLKIIEYTLAFYNLGKFKISSSPIKYIADNITNTSPVPPSFVEIVPVKRKPTDKDDIRDIRKPVHFKTYLWLLIILLVILISTGIFIFLKYKHKIIKKEKVEILREYIPPHVEALEKIEELLKQNLIEKGEIKKFYFEISEIIREYLNKRFKIQTLERTSAEILGDLKKLLNMDIYIKFSDFFEHTDLVKFSKYTPTGKEIRDTVELAKELINKTKREIKDEVL